MQCTLTSIWKLTAASMSLLALATFCTFDVMAQANSKELSLTPDVVFQVPEESPGPPFYAISANGGFIPQDGVWAAIPFLRELQCVPPGANLLQITGPFAFQCTLTVEGHEHWENGPFVDLAPRQTQFYGLGEVPIIFVQLTELEPALAGGLSLSELLALPSTIVGTAIFYKETDIFGISGPQGAGRGSYKINARGNLSDGRPFSLLVNEVLGQLQVVQISFGRQ
ncbi:MAG TPA: hypothetical protein VJS64_02220 [Pyrinomonadaceae bacterium]|nr:hypothetical protein [Pyrinomonadaceae bacterium]